MSYADFLNARPGRVPLACYGQRQFYPRQPVIYALLDPQTHTIRYIGKTIQHPTARLRAHLQERSHCHRSHWIQSLLSQHLRPHLVVLEAIQAGACWQGIERYWIAYGKARHWPLTNNTSGGDGVCDLPPETKARMRLTWLGRKHRPESIERLKAARAKRVTTPDTRAKMSRSQQGRSITWIDKIAERNRKITPNIAQIISVRLEAGELVTALAREYGVHRTTLSKLKLGRYFTRGQS